MLENYLVRGLLIGLIFGAPAGAIGALTIQRTLNGGFAAGLFTGLGSSAADLLYACAGIFGVTLVSEFLTRYQRPISLLGGLMIMALGVHIFRQKPQEELLHAAVHVCTKTGRSRTRRFTVTMIYVQNVETRQHSLLCLL